MARGSPPQFIMGVSLLCWKVVVGKGMSCRVKAFLGGIIKRESESCEFCLSGKVRQTQDKRTAWHRDMDSLGKINRDR